MKYSKVCIDEEVVSPYVRGRYDIKWTGVKNKEKHKLENINWLREKFSELTSNEVYGRQ